MVTKMVTVINSEHGMTFMEKILGAYMPQGWGGQWIQYQLDNSSTLSEVIENNKKIRIVSNIVPLHYFICDSLALLNCRTFCPKNVSQNKQANLRGPKTKVFEIATYLNKKVLLTYPNLNIGTTFGGRSLSFKPKILKATLLNFRNTI